MYSFALSEMVFLSSAWGSAVDPFRSMRHVHLVFLRVVDLTDDAVASGMAAFPADFKNPLQDGSAADVLCLDSRRHEVGQRQVAMARLRLDYPQMPVLPVVDDLRSVMACGKVVVSSAHVPFTTGGCRAYWRKSGGQEQF